MAALAQLTQAQAARKNNITKNLQCWQDLVNSADLLTSRIADDLSLAQSLMQLDAVKSNTQHLEALQVFIQTATITYTRCTALMKDVPRNGLISKADANVYYSTGAAIDSVTNEYMRLAHPQIASVLDFAQSLSKAPV